MIKAIFFDYDDTLVQTKISKWDALKATGKRFYNLDITSEDITPFWGLPYEKMLVGVLRNADTLENLKQNYEQTHVQFPMLAHKDAQGVVGKLLKKYPVGIVTASSRKLVLEDLTMLHFPIDKFIYIQTSEDTTIHKPDPDVFIPILKILHENQIPNSEILYVGDSLKDYQAANGAGLQFLGITHGITSGEEFKKSNVQTVTSFNDLFSKLC